MVRRSPSSSSSYANARPYFASNFGNPSSNVSGVTSLNQNVMYSFTRFFPAQIPSLLVREAVHELDQHRRRQRDEAELLAVGIPLDELPKGTVDERVHACVALFGKVPQTFVRVLFNPDRPRYARFSRHEPPLPHASQHIVLCVLRCSFALFPTVGHTR